MQTPAPASAIACAIAWPMPLPAPVTIATLPVRFMSCLSVATDDQVGDEACPPRLVRGAEARAGIAVEILVEEQRVAPGRILLELGGRAERRTTAVFVAEKQRD